MKKYKYIVLLLSVLLCTFIGCNESTDINAEQQDGDVSAPHITSFSPELGAPGTFVKIIGDHLNKVTEVTIGGEVAKIKHRVSKSEVLVEVTANSKSGVITLKNTKGVGTSESSFNIEVAIPIISVVETAKPNEMIIGEMIEITGENLKSVTRILMDNVEAEIQFLNDTEIRFAVPTIEAGKTIPVTVEYMEGEIAKAVESSAKFLIKRSTEAPTITETPTSALIATSVTMKGTNMDIINSIKLGDLTVTLTAQTSTEIAFSIPSIYGKETTLDLKIVFNGDEEMVAIPNFKVEVPTISDEVYFYGALTLGAEGTNASEDIKHFIDPRNGGIFYTACDNYAELKANTHFYITTYTNEKDNITTIQLNNPNNSKTQSMRFKCNGTALEPEALTSVVKYRVLNPGSGAQNKYIQQIKERTLGKITPEKVLADGITNATTSTPRYGSNFNIGDVVMFNKYDSKGVTVESVGFMEIIDVKIDENNLSESTLTVHCFFQK